MADADYAPLMNFPIAWRWTQASHAVLPAEILATIHPLTAAAADTLTAKAHAIWDTRLGLAQQSDAFTQWPTAT